VKKPPCVVRIKQRRLEIKGKVRKKKGKSKKEKRKKREDGGPGFAKRQLRRGKRRAEDR
jgi:hypothetical protein